ncbi:hypothetical protein [Rhizosphaericola mali]|uniref:Uncharacterized protein n=1 Tax=Rhizosphaericola mali TaxID=2545455 RepID=A0A5P2G2A7_9BACT|nr:hypothetical protein [Rhizosphaericola mali]QES88848.1 hypothetical protein E0W69_009340 [Rhizosphaericola mali]
MKARLITLVILFFAKSSYSQTEPQIPVQNISTDSSVVYRLFATKNMYNFIKLNTRNGQMSQVQWGADSDHRFESTLSYTSLVSEREERNGRFFLYPTTNIYNFLLLDQFDGRMWQVQWNFDNDKKMVIRIY